MLAVCPQCGLSQEPANNFCRNCGAQVDDLAQAKFSGEQKKQGRIAAAALLALGVFLLVMALYYHLFS